MKKEEVYSAPMLVAGPDGVLRVKRVKMPRR